MRPIKRISGFIRRQKGFRRVLLHQLLVAALFTFLAFIFAIIFNASMSYMGNKDDAAAAFVLKNFWHVILFTQLKILLVYFAGFSLIGFLSAGCIHGYSRVTDWTASGRIYRVVSIFLPAFIFLHWFGYSVLQWPAAYSRTLFEKGGIRRALEVFLTDGPGPGYYNLVLGAGVLIAAAILVLFLRRIAAEGRFSRPAGTIARFSRRVWVRVSAAAAVLLLIVTAVAGSSSSLHKHAKKNLLIIASDALRPDRLSVNGYHRRTTPELDRFFAGATSFERVYAEVPRTFPSWVSILCSRYSVSHGIRHMFPTRKERNRKFPSLMFALKKAGYRTGVVSDFAGDIFPRIRLGFDRVLAPHFNFDALLTQGNLEIHTFLFPFLLNGVGRKVFPVLREFAQLPDGNMIADETIGMIRDFARKGPFAVTMFLSTTHFPYANRYPWYKKFSSSGYNGFFKYYKQQVVMQGQKALGPADIRQVNALYDGGVAAADASAGKVLRFVRENGLLDNTIVVLVADHGENLYEPGMGMGHGEHLRGDYSTRIPFIVAGGRRKGPVRRVNALASCVDIAPTIASLLNIPRNRQWEGRNLSHYINGRGRAPAPGFAYSETGIWFSDRGDHFFQKQRIMYPDITKMSEIDFKHGREVVLRGGSYPGVIISSKHRSWREGRYKLIYIPTRERVLWELYDTRNDPDNRTNLIRRYPGVAARLQKKLISFCSASGRDEYVNGYFIPGGQ